LPQHGQMQAGQADDPEAHFAKFVEHLELTDTQRDALAGPFQEAFAAMQELHRLHGVIAAELSDEQKEKVAQMMHQAMGGGMHMEHEGMHGEGGMHEHGEMHEDGEVHEHGEGHQTETDAGDPAGPGTPAGAAL